MKTYILLFFFVAANCSLSAQENSKNSINFSMGLGQLVGYYNSDTYGITYSIGYERQMLKKIIAKDKLRINPRLNIAHFLLDNQNFSSYEKRFVNSFIFDTRINLDIVKIKSISIVVSSGLFLGIRNITYKSSPNISSNNYSKKRYGNGGALYAYGVRINTSRNKLGINIIRTKYIDLFKEHNIMFGLEYDL